MLQIAFKEWAIICRALATGKQALILRKGGIVETGGEFRPEHSRFWLYPTYLHEHRNGVKLEFQPEFDQIHAERPLAGIVRLTHFAEVSRVFHATRLEQIASLDDLHQWSADAVTMKFHYRQPGLFVLPVRVYRVTEIDLTETPAYAGCKTWVELERPLSTDGAMPVLADEVFSGMRMEIDRRSNA
jgi:hypothetical protein